MRQRGRIRVIVDISESLELCVDIFWKKETQLFGHIPLQRKMKLLLKQVC